METITRKKLLAFMRRNTITSVHVFHNGMLIDVCKTELGKRLDFTFWYPKEISMPHIQAYEHIFLYEMFRFDTYSNYLAPEDILDIERIYLMHNAVKKDDINATLYSLMTSKRSWIDRAWYIGCNQISGSKITPCNWERQTYIPESSSYNSSVADSSFIRVED